MTNAIMNLARERLLTPAEMGENEIQRVFSVLSTRELDDADLYFQSVHTEGFSLEEGKVKSGSSSLEQGVGVRAVVGEKQALAYSDDLHFPSVLEAAEMARAISRDNKEATVPVLAEKTVPALYRPENPLLALDSGERVELLMRVEAAAKAADPRIVQVMASLVGRMETIVVARLDGSLAMDIRPLVRLSVMAVAEQNGRREQGSAGGGGRVSLSYFLEEERAENYAREAVRQALVNLEAVDAPAGAMDVVLGPGWPGILLHEAIGHGLEGDFNRKGTSAFSGKVGQRVAAANVTVVDDGTLPERRGSVSIDDEGTPGGKNILIENGILKGYMQDRLNARLMNVAATGNGRRESYADLVLPRMTNTYMLPGQHDPQEIIASVKKGLYATHFGGGQVDITNGKFVFSASEAYLIEDGKITKPVKGATLIGNGPDVLTRVSMVGKDLELDPGIGTCGKDGQSVPVGVGQPTIKVENLTVGGTAG